MDGAVAALSISEYLSSTYRPDCEWIDGELRERNPGEYDHANLQGALIAFFRSRQREYNIRACLSNACVFQLPASESRMSA